MKSMNGNVRLPEIGVFRRRSLSAHGNRITKIIMIIIIIAIVFAYIFVQHFGWCCASFRINKMVDLAFGLYNEFKEKQSK